MAPYARLPIEAQNKLVAQNCASCHSEKRHAGELVLAGFDAAKVTEHPDVTEKMIRKLRAGMMPPPGRAASRRGDARRVRRNARSEDGRGGGAQPESRLAAVPAPQPRRVSAAVKDLLGIDVDVNAFLPPDTISKGFDNVADVQAFSPTLMESYLRAASSISRLAVGDRGAQRDVGHLQDRPHLSQMRHVDGAPMGTRGGISVVHTFPADGDYVVKVVAAQRAARRHLRPHDDGDDGHQGAGRGLGQRRARRAARPQRADERDRSEEQPRHQDAADSHPAGPQRISAAFIQRFDGPVDDLLVPLENTLADVNISFGVTALPHMRDMTILGPSAVTGVSDTISRRMVFTCRPTSAEGRRDLRRRHRQGADGARVPRRRRRRTTCRTRMAFYEKGRKSGDFESGIRMALQSVLMSPRFLFRLEQAPPAVAR